MQGAEQVHGTGRAATVRWRCHPFLECSNFRHSHSRSSTEFSATSPSDRAHSAVGISPRLVQVSAVASSGPRFSFSCRGFDFLRWPPFFLFGWPFVPWQHHAASSFPVARRQVRPFLLARAVCSPFFPLVRSCPGTSFPAFCFFGSGWSWWREDGDWFLWHWSPVTQCISTESELVW